MFDLIIRNGKIVDGSGAEAFMGDIAILNGRIAKVGAVTGSAKKEVDAEGHLVTPGWVDIHTHYDGQVTWDPYLTPSSWHGATTIVMGNCGVGFAPVRAEDREMLINLMESVEDIPGSALAEGINWEWESFPEYLDALDKMPRAIDVGAQVPHCSVRAYVMGERCMTEKTANAEDIEAMKDIVAEGLKAGAIGFSTSRTMVHLTKDNQPIPGTFAGEEEMRGMGEAIQKAGHGVIELSSDFTEDDADLGWMRKVSKEYNVPISMNVVQVPFRPTHYREVLENIDAANDDGAELYAQVSGRTVGLLLTLEGTVNPFTAKPSYREIAELPLEERVRIMKDPAFKEKILSEKNADDIVPIGVMILASIGNMFRLGDEPDYEPPQEESLASLAEAQGITPEELAYEILLENEGRGAIYFPLVNYTDGNFDAIREMMMHPKAIMGLSDGGAHCGVICDVSMPSFMLTHWVRDRKRGERVPLEWMVRKQTSETASLYGLNDRGLIKAGYKADINIIDFENLKILSPRMVYDLPTDARRLIQEAEGYRMTICSGEIIFENGKETGALPGKLIRGPQSAPANVAAAE